MWNNVIQISKVASSNCGGMGAWIDNPLSSPNPSGSLWKGFQLGGGGRRTQNKNKSRKKSHKKPHKKPHKKTSNTRKRRQIKRRRNW
jgi:hypothetical protein